MTGQNIPSKKELKKIFIEKHRSKKFVYNDEFHTGYQKAQYLKNDTIVFTENGNSLESIIPKEVRWKVESRNNVSIIELNLLTEPPMITYTKGQIGLRIKIKKDEKGLKLLLYNESGVIDEFLVLNFEYSNEVGRELTLLRL